MRGFLICLLWLAPFTVLKAQEVDSGLAATLQQKLEEQLGNTGAPGISAALWMEGEGLWRGATGISGSDGSPVTSDLRFGIASITKTFVATLILRLQEEGKLSLDDSLHSWLPRSPWLVGETTIRQLLNHTSGIYNFWTHPTFWDRIREDLGHHWTHEEILATFMDRWYFWPGTRYQYSSTNYTLLGRIAEAADGPVEQSLRDRFWTPLDLKSFYLAGYEAETGERAVGWADLDSDGIAEDAAHWYAPAMHSVKWTTGGLFATAADVTIAGRELLLGTLVSPESLQEMLTFVPTAGDGYGLGIIRFRSMDTVFYGHSGNTVGYSSFFVCSPERRVCATALLNQTGLPAHDVVNALLETALEFDQTSTASGRTPEVPVALALRPAFPNPAQDVAFIPFELREAGPVRVEVFDMTGRRMAAPREGHFAAGSNLLRLEMGAWATGPYFYRVVAGSGSGSFGGVLVKAR